MKNIFLLIVIGTFCACNNINKEELKKEIISELKANTQQTLKKGDGSHFYSEPVYLGSSGTFIHEVDIQHSTINCPAIRNGVQRNCYKLNPYDNTFCSVCMTDELITMWNNRFFPDGYKKK